MAGRKGQRTPRAFGTVRQLPSGRFQASYIGPDTARHTGPHTFDEREDAEGWLADVKRAIRAETWTPKHQVPDDDPPPLFGPYAVRWLDTREVKGRPLKTRTVENYADLLDAFILPTFADHAVDDISVKDVRAWHSSLRDKTGPTRRAHAYSLLRAILGTAVADGYLQLNPCQIKGAGQAPRASVTKIATLDELDKLREAMPEHLRALVLLAAWCGLRFGECAELRRGDVELVPEADPPTGLVHVRRGVVRTKTGRLVGDTKSQAGFRAVPVPPHVVQALADHLTKHAAKGAQGLLFPGRRNGEQLAHSSMSKPFNRAREAIGRPDLRFHDLRHTGLTLAAQAGATLAELMARAGHSTPAAALRYQHATDVRGQLIAAELSRIAGKGSSVPKNGQLEVAGIAPE